MENIFLLQVMYIMNNIEYHFENVYSNLEKAHQVGKEFFEKNDIKKQVIGLVEMTQFRIIKFNPINVEKNEDGINLKEYNKNTSWKEFIYNLEPTKTTYTYNLDGELAHCEFEMYYKNLDKNTLEIYNIVMLPEDFEANAGRKFNVGDIVTLKEKDYIGNKNDKSKYVIKQIPYKKEYQKYFENFYSVQKVNSDDTDYFDVREEDIILY